MILRKPYVSKSKVITHNIECGTSSLSFVRPYIYSITLIPKATFIIYSVYK